MNLHIMNDNTYANTFITDLFENCSKEDKVIIITGKKVKYITKENQQKVIVINYKELRCLLRNMRVMKNTVKSSENIVYHMLTIPAVFFTKYFNLKKKKLFWMIWGTDLYDNIPVRLYSDSTIEFLANKKDVRSIKQRVKEIILKKLTKSVGKFTVKIDCVLTWNYGDYMLAKEYFHIDASWKDFHYPLRLKFLELDKELFPKENKKYQILVGNSAAPSNNLIEVYKMLSKTKGDFQVLSLLTYGDPDYKKFAIKKGKELLGDKFIPITEHMSIESYMAFIENIDVLIINHYRQQGVGNIVSFLQKGKKVYMNKFVTTYDYLKENDVIVYSVDDLERIVHIDELVAYDENIKSNNSRKVYELFSDDAALEKINKIFQ